MTADKKGLDDLLRAVFKKMHLKKISPRYFSITGISEDEPKVVKLELGFNKWYEIPTKEEKNFNGVIGATIDDIILIQGRNILADIVYGGEIECVNDEKSDIEIKSYPPENPLFHSKNMTIGKEGYYRFTTQYAPEGKRKIPGLDKARNTLQRERNEEVAEKFLGEVKNNNLLSTLRRVFEEVIRSRNDKDRRHGYYHFEELFEEYITTGTFSGDCKAISTFTTGIIESLGLGARIVDGNIHYGIPKLMETKGPKYWRDGSGHVWTEAFIPQENGKGYWIPVDPAFGIFLNFPSWPDRYALNRIRLPSFKDQSIVTAKLKLQYV